MTPDTPRRQAFVYEWRCGVGIKTSPEG
jgi:hypothetical protein